MSPRPPPRVCDGRADPAPSPASPHFLRHRDLLARAARLGPILDVACGAGRHSLAAAELGAHSIGIDRDADALRTLRGAAAARALPIEALRADLETPHGLPFVTGVFGAILVFRFLFRPLCPALARALRPGGLLLYETFTSCQKDLPYGPKNPDFLLDPGELPARFPGLEVLHFEEGRFGDARPEALARLLARRPG